MPPPSRRVWCSCTVIYYLVGKSEAEPCRQIVEQIKREPGQHEIIVSVLAEAEVVKLEDVEDDIAEKRILEFLGRDYVVRVPMDILIAEDARRLVRKYQIKPLDAVHIATALYHEIPILETYDEEMIERVNEKEGMPPLVIRKPVYEGQLSLS